MIIGHYAVALAAKKYAPKTSLGVLFLASQFLDLLCILFLILGIEKIEVAHFTKGLIPVNFTFYPFSHSLVMAFIWSLFFSIVLLLFKGKREEAAIVFFVSFSHWFLDFLVHRQDLSVWLRPSRPGLGLGLWDFPFAVSLLEGGLFLAGLAVYLQSRSSARMTKLLWLFLLSALLLHAVVFLIRDLPSMNEVVYAVALTLHLYFIFLGFWIERSG